MERREEDEYAVIGIDLGSTYCRVAVFSGSHGTVEIVPNEQGYCKTPSYVAFTNHERFIGDLAKNQAAMNPVNTIFDVKCLIGRRFSDLSVQKDVHLWPFKVIQGPRDQPRIAVKYKGEEKQFAPEEITSMLLMKMRDIAEAFLGKTVQNAIVTVPTWFNYHQRWATLDAAIIAGLNVRKVISEPCAAATTYCLHMDTGLPAGKKNVLFFDLGGRSLNVCLVIIEERILEKKSTSGDYHLGGEDFNNRMVNHLVQEMKWKTKKDIRGNARAMTKLQTACERAKINLSAACTTTIEIDSLHEGVDFYTTITRATFEELNMDLFTTCIEHVRQCLRGADMDKSSIHEVVLLGGSSRIPMVQQLLKTFFNGKELCKTINPDEAVAYGAAVQAANHSGKKFEDMLLLEATPFSLGIKTPGKESMTVIVPRDTTTAINRAEVFSTHEDNQDSMVIEIYEGDRIMVRDNNLLGKLKISRIPPAPKGVPQILVSIDVCAYGTLVVEARDMATGYKDRASIGRHNGGLMYEEITKMVLDSEKYKAEDEERERKVEAKNRLENYSYETRRILENENVSRRLSFGYKKEIENAIEGVIEWCEKNEEAEVEKFEYKLKELQNICNPWNRDA